MERVKLIGSKGLGLGVLEDLAWLRFSVSGLAKVAPHNGANSLRWLFDTSTLDLCGIVDKHVQSFR